MFFTILLIIFAVKKKIAIIVRFCLLTIISEGKMNNKTQAVLDLFEELDKVPRQSKHEEKISAWLVEWAEKHGLKAERDESMNVLIKAPATPGYEDKPTVVIQGHMDMVCEKNGDKVHDFDKDPIEAVLKGEWLHANGTTLGADDGIGVAAALAVIADKNVKHGPTRPFGVHLHR